VEIAAANEAGESAGKIDDVTGLERLAHTLHATTEVDHAALGPRVTAIANLAFQLFTHGRSELALALLGASSLRCGGGNGSTSSADGGGPDGSLAADAPSGSSSGGADGASSSSSSSGGSIDGGSGGSSGGSSDAGDGGVPIDPDAFYVATNGDDGNPGTLALPFATLAHAQTAMRASSNSKTTYVRAGTYQPPMTGATCLYGNAAGSAIELLAADQGETWSFYPPDGYGSAILDGQSTTGNSGGTGGNGVGCAFAASGASGVRIVQCMIGNAAKAKRSGAADLSCSETSGN